MTAQKGKDLLLKIDTDGLGSFATVAGLRSRRIAFNAESVDVTDADSAGRWRELLEGAGVKRAGVAGSGIFKDASRRRDRAPGVLRRHHPRLAGDRAGLRHARRAFQVTALEYSGEHDGEVAYELALESAGALGFTAA